MLPKLQQSSLAQSLRKDNPALLIQGIRNLMKPRISWRTSWTDLTTSHINHGKINTPLRTHTHPLGISRAITSPRRRWLKQGVNLTMSWPFRVLFISLRDWEELVEWLHLLWRRNPTSSHLHPKVELSKKGKCLLQNSEGTMTGLICPLKLITRARLSNWCGKYLLKVWITITTCLSSSMDVGKKSTLIVPLPLWEHMICWTKEEARFYLSFRN